MKTHHCKHCQILIFISKTNAYSRTLREVVVHKDFTFNVREGTNSKLMCERCNYELGEYMEYMNTVNYFFELNKMKIYTIPDSN